MGEGSPLQQQAPVTWDAHSSPLTWAGEAFLSRATVLSCTVLPQSLEKGTERSLPRLQRGGTVLREGVWGQTMHRG